jgi:hypothetical protein
MADFTPLSPTQNLPTLANASSWYNLTAWTANVTRYAPSLEDLLLAGPRMVKKLGFFIASEITDGTGHPHLASTAATTELLQAAATAANHHNMMDINAGAGEGMADDIAAHASRLASDGTRGLGSVFSYATSRWALASIAMAIILNRTHVYAATRRRLQFRWPIRLLLRFLPILLIAMQAVRLLASIQCQTSPDFSELRWGNASKSSDLMFSHRNRFLNGLGSVILRNTDEQSCRIVKMIPTSEDGSAHDLRGSLSILWPLFGTFCLSHFTETLSCAVQGRPLAYETAMTLFEQSLAFAEADAAVSNQIGWNAFAKTTAAGKSATGGAIAITRSMILKRVNTSPEVLFVAFLSAMTHLSSHMLGVLDLQAKFRLVNTGFWALCFMATLVWTAVTFDLDDPASQGLLRYPTVCIIGLVPHILVLIGIILCLIIYGIGLLLSALSPPNDEGQASMTFRQRIAHAHQNMQANVSLSEIRITREMDIYTALLRTGFTAVTMASEAVYLNEDRGVSLKQHTWLEEARLQEAEELQKQWVGLGLANSRYDQVGAIGLVPVEGTLTSSSNGFNRERVAQKQTKGRGDRSMRVGVGATERSARWLMALELFLSINRLFARIGAISILWILGVARIRTKPEWLLRLARRDKQARDAAASSNKDDSSAGSGSRRSRVAETDVLDVEAEIRRTADFNDEERLDADLYSYWLSGGWWGSKDSSGDFQPTTKDDDWDITSVISASTALTDAASERGWESESDDGMRTPTQRSPRGGRSGTPFMDSPLSMNDFAKLLQPTNPEERENAKTLAAHIQSDRILTRSRYRRMEQLQRTRILTNSNSGLQPFNAGTGLTPGRAAKLTPEDEEQVLEQLLLARRQAASEGSKAGASWKDGADGLGTDGPQCVVCQSTPRSIIVWPCRCLSLCDDCRVSLAMNNFDKCVCCRREVISFSRIFVP